MTEFYAKTFIKIGPYPPTRLTFALQVKEEEDELDLLLQQAEALYR